MISPDKYKQKGSEVQGSGFKGLEFGVLGSEVLGTAVWDAEQISKHKKIPSDKLINPFEHEYRDAHFVEMFFVFSDKVVYIIRNALII